MSDENDIEGLASEFVLGTLDISERATIAARRLREPSLDAAIGAWEQRLMPLIYAIPPVQPPAEVFQRIEELIGRRDRERPDDVTDIAALRRKVNRWRGSALAASAIAASLAIFVGVKELAPNPPSQTFVAVLQKDATSPAFLATVDVDAKTLTVRPVAAQRETGKSYELWLVHDSLGAPKSLGLIDDPNAMTKPTLAYKPDVIENATFAVSLEPEGGSTTGAPTGPVLFAGKLIPTSGR